MRQKFFIFFTIIDIGHRILRITIKDWAKNMSPFMRNTAAHAVSKLYSLDADICTGIVEIIAKLIKDKVSLVLGSAVAAFEKFYPDRINLINENYCKFCQVRGWTREAIALTEL